MLGPKWPRICIVHVYRMRAYHDHTIASMKEYAIQGGGTYRERVTIQQRVRESLCFHQRQAAAQAREPACFMSESPEPAKHKFAGKGSTGREALSAGRTSNGGPRADAEAARGQ